MHNNPRPLSNQMFGQLYDELRLVAQRLMRRESHQHILQSTALVHEAYVRLADHRANIYGTRGEFLAAATAVMRRILVDFARARRSLKRGGDKTHVNYAENEVGSPATNFDLLDLNEAIQELESLDKELAAIVKLRFFAGLPTEDVARMLALSKRTVERRWIFIKAWLAVKLTAHQAN